MFVPFPPSIDPPVVFHWYPEPPLLTTSKKLSSKRKMYRGVFNRLSAHVVGVVEATAIANLSANCLIAIAPS